MLNIKKHCVLVNIFLDQHNSAYLDYRWRLFFMAYFETLLALNRYTQLIKTYNKQKLQAKEAVLWNVRMQFPE